MDGPDPILALEHDHVHLSRLVAELRAAIRAFCEGDGGGAEQRAEIVGILSAIRDDLFEHFAREEEALFPYLAQELPDHRGALARLEAGHDRICGGVSRLLAMFEKNELSNQLVAQLFERFDAEYGDHARGESELLRGLAPRLGAEQRARVREIMRAV